MSAQTDQKYPILVVCALIVQDGKVLLERHAPTLEYSVHQWDIPSGKVEIGETPLKAVVREIQEEMGVTIQPFCLLPKLYNSIWTDPDSSKHWILAVYGCRIIAGEPPLGDDLQWLDVRALNPAEVKTPDLEIIQSYASKVETFPLESTRS